MNIDDLPSEMFSKILSYFKFEELMVLEHVSHHWKSSIKSSSVWNQLHVYFDINEFSKTRSVYCKIRCTSSILQQVINHASVIKKLTLKNLRCCKRLTLLLQKCHQLEMLTLIDCDIQNRGLQNIGKLTHLRSFKIYGCFVSPICMCSEQSNMDFSLLSNLKYIELNQTVLSDKNFNSLFMCQKIVHFDIANVKNVKQSNVVQFLNQNKIILETLCLSAEESYDDELFLNIVKCHQLKNLSLLSTSNNQNFTDQSILTLQKLKLAHFKLFYFNNFSEKALHSTFSSPNWLDTEYMCFIKSKFLVRVKEESSKWKLLKDSIQMMQINEGLPKR